MASDAKKSSSKSRSRANTSRYLAVCVRNEGYPASLDLGKLYEVRSDEFADAHGLVRVVDESGEDYLYAADFFVRIDLPKELEATLRRIVRKRSAA